MQKYKVFKEGFLEHMEETKSSGPFTDLHCRDIWKFDAAQVIRNESSPNMNTYFKYCKAIGKCPVKFMIVLLKNFLNPTDLIDFIRSLYNLK